LKRVSIILLLIFASINNAYAIKISSENTGQLLLAPVYFSHDIMLTKLTVINTRVDAAVVARIVVRDYKASAELLETLIFLSPGDVWNGALYGGGNQTRLYSSDDSALKSDLTFASPQAPLNIALSHGSAHSGINNIGHIEITGLSSVQADHLYCSTAGKLNPTADETQCKSVMVKQGMSKNDLYQLYSYAADVTSLRADSHGNLIYKQIDSDGGGFSMVEPDKLQITGMAEAVIESGSGFNYNMTALEPTHYQWGNIGININMDLPLPKTGTHACNSTKPYSCFPNYVISNPLFAISTVQNNDIGFNFGSIDSSLSFQGDTADHVIAIEALLAKTKIKHRYMKGKTLLVTTFPTKYRHLTSSGHGVCYDFYGLPDSDETDASLYTSPFFWDEPGSLYYELTSFDHQENSFFIPGPEIPEPPKTNFSGGGTPETPPVPPNEQTIEPEVWISSLDQHYAFNEGWASLKYIYKEGCGYSGVPSISYTLMIEEKSILLEKTF